MWERLDGVGGVVGSQRVGPRDEGEDDAGEDVEDYLFVDLCGSADASTGDR